MIRTSAASTNVALSLTGTSGLPAVADGPNAMEWSALRIMPDIGKVDGRVRAVDIDWVAACITIRHTGVMAKAISVRLDEETERALQTLEASGLSRSDAIRSALISSADRMRSGRELAAEVAALEADEADRDEMLAVSSLMESMRASG